MIIINKKAFAPNLDLCIDVVNGDWVNITFGQRVWSLSPSQAERLADLLLAAVAIAKVAS